LPVAKVSFFFTPLAEVQDSLTVVFFRSPLVDLSWKGTNFFREQILFFREGDFTEAKVAPLWNPSSYDCSVKTLPNPCGFFGRASLTICPPRCSSLFLIPFLLRLNFLICFLFPPRMILFLRNRFFFLRVPPRFCLPPPVPFPPSFPCLIFHTTLFF